MVVHTLPFLGSRRGFTELVLCLSQGAEGCLDPGNAAVVAAKLETFNPSIFELCIHTSGLRVCTEAFFSPILTQKQNVLSCHFSAVERGIVLAHFQRRLGPLRGCGLTEGSQLSCPAGTKQRPASLTH